MLPAILLQPSREIILFKKRKILKLGVPGILRTFLASYVPTVVPKRKSGTSRKTFRSYTFERLRKKRS